LIEKAIDKLVKAIFFICVVLLFIVVSVTTAQVIARFIFKGAIVWAEEVARYAGIWFVMLSTAIAILRRSHMVIDLVTNLLPKRVQLILVALSDLIILFVSGYMCYSQVLLMNKFFNVATPALRMPMGIVYLGVAVGWAISTVIALYMFVKSVKVAFSPIQKSEGGDKL